MQYGINKGIGRSAEFRGLTAQYLFLFAGGLLAVFVLVVVMYMAGVNQLACIGFGIAAGGGVVAATFGLNARYGAHGLMKRSARKRHPRRIVSRRPVSGLLNTQ